MMNDKNKLVTALAIALIISGCDSGGSSGRSDSDVGLDDPSTAVTAGGSSAPEVSVSTETNSSLAIPVMPLSSSQMDDFVKNPLIATIPAELSSSSNNAQSRRYITNPLIN